MTATLFPLDDDRQRQLLAGLAVVVNVGKGRDPLEGWAKERGLLVYIGHAARGGWRESPLANPYRVKHHGRAEAIRLFRDNLERRPDLLAMLPQLHGRALGCWCWPEPCHGDVLAALVNAQF